MKTAVWNCLPLLLVATIIAGAHANEQSRDDQALSDELRAAAGAGDLARVEELLGMDVHPDARRGSNRGWTALELVAMGIHGDAVQAMLAESPGLQGQQLLDKKLELEVAIAKRLIDAGAKSFDRSLLRTSNPKLLRLIVESGGSPNLAWKGALASNDTDLIRFLVHAGATFDAEVGHRSVPFVQAGTWSSVEVLQTLIELGADPNATSEFENTALHTACARGRELNVIKKLIELGVDPSRRNKNGKLAVQELRGTPKARVYLEGIARASQQARAPKHKVGQIDALIDKAARPGWRSEIVADLAKTGPEGAKRIVARLRRGPFSHNLLATLKTMGPDASPAIPWLIESLHEPELALQVAATLQEISSDAWSSVPLADRVAGAEAAYKDLVTPGSQTGKSVQRFAEVFGELSHPHLSQLLSHRLLGYRMAAARALPYVRGPNEQLMESVASCMSKDQPPVLRQMVARSLIVNREFAAPEIEKAAIKGMLELGSVKDRAISTKVARERRATLIEFFNVATLYQGSPLRKLLDECPPEERNAASEAIALAVRHAGREDRSEVLGLLGTDSKRLQRAIGFTLGLDAMSDKSLRSHLEETYRTGDPSERDTAALALAQMDDEGADARRQGILEDRRLALTTRAFALLSRATDAADAPEPSESSEELVEEIGKVLNRSDESDQYLYLSTLRALRSEAQSALPAVRDLAAACEDDPEGALLHQAAALTIRAIE